MLREYNFVWNYNWEGILSLIAAFIWGGRKLLWPLPHYNLIDDAHCLKNRIRDQKLIGTGNVTQFLMYAWCCHFPTVHMLRLIIAMIMVVLGQFVLLTCTVHHLQVMEIA